ncbi:MAG: enoyl-CoA hydratase/isomerase family protein [Pseudomonadota bacterium]
MITLDKAPGGLWLVTIARAEKANSLTAAMLTELLHIAEAAADEARALVLTGAGNKVFSAGADLDEARNGLTVDPIWERLSGAIASLPIPTIAALNGTCAGGAFGMMLACDMRLTVPHASFFYPVAKLGYLPQPSDPGRMRALIGLGRSKLILLAAEKIGAEEALDWGLVDRIVLPEALMAAAKSLLATALAGERETMSQIKALVDG